MATLSPNEGNKQYLDAETHLTQPEKVVELSDRIKIYQVTHKSTQLVYQAIEVHFEADTASQLQPLINANIQLLNAVRTKKKFMSIKYFSTKQGAENSIRLTIYLKQFGCNLAEMLATQ